MKREGGGHSKKDDGIPPIAELAGFEFPPDTEFAEQVRRSIGNREVASGLVDLSTRGLFKLLMDYLSTFLDILDSSSGQETGRKEK